MVTKIHHIIHILLLHNSTNSKSKMIYITVNVNITRILIFI